MKLTTNLNLKKPDYVDDVDIADINENMDKIDQQISSLKAYAVASGTNTYIATIAGITSLTEGISIRIKFTNANTGASTLNINSLGAKAIVKSNGAALSSGNIKAGQICNLAYTGSNFQLLGEGGEYGTATSSDVLSGKTIGTEEGLVTGTMPNRGAVNQNLTTEGQEYTIPSGYHNGLGKVKAVITGLVASTIKAGATVGSIVGTFTSDATAIAAQMLSGVTAYVNGNKITGTIPSKSAQTYTPGTTTQTIVAGQYLSGAQIIEGSANLIESNIRKGVNLFGKVGTLIEGINLNNVITNIGNGSEMREIRTYSAPPNQTSTITVNHILFKVYISVDRTFTSVDDVLFRSMPVTATQRQIVGKTFAATTTDYMVMVFNPNKTNVTIPHNGNNFSVYVYID